MRKSIIVTFSALVLAFLISIPGMVQAVEEFKVSDFAAAIQIWFEAEDFDERNPEGDRYFIVTGQPGAPEAPKGAFGEAVTRRGGSGGMIRWDFDISFTEGEAGTWYFWGRVHNVGNLSDYMLVKDDPDDDIPNGPPFPGGDAAAPFDNEDDRVFEATSAEWSWWGGGDEGSDKELQDGENSMYMFHRQGAATVFWDVFMWTDDATYRPSDEDYTNAKIAKKKPEAVQPLEKLSTSWGSIKARLEL